LIPRPKTLLEEKSSLNYGEVSVGNGDELKTQLKGV